jgi:uncharacterized damage-inducible protein DinB
MTQRIVILQALSNTAAVLEELLEQADFSQWNVSPGPGEWSAEEVLEHLLYVEVRYLQRLNRIIAEERPLLPKIPPELDPPRAYQIPADVLERFRLAREATVAFLKGLSPEDWLRPAVHETKGATDLHFLVLDLVDHDRQHRKQIGQLLGKLARQQRE